MPAAISSLHTSASWLCALHSRCIQSTWPTGPLTSKAAGRMVALSAAAIFAACVVPRTGQESEELSLYGSRFVDYIMVTPYHAPRCLRGVTTYAHRTDAAPIDSRLLQGSRRQTRNLIEHDGYLSRHAKVAPRSADELVAGSPCQGILKSARHLPNLARR